MMTRAMREKYSTHDWADVFRICVSDSNPLWPSPFSSRPLLLSNCIMSSSCCSAKSAAAPSVCTLSATDLVKRMEELASIGRQGLVSSTSDADVNKLTFRADASVLTRLKGIVQAESVCCSFLRLELDESPERLLLSISSKTEEGKGMAEQLAKAFGQGAAQ
jgi:hypothetical protein